MRYKSKSQSVSGRKPGMPRQQESKKIMRRCKYAKYTKEDWKSLIKDIANKYRNGNIGEITTTDFLNHGFGGALRFWQKDYTLSGLREALNDMIQICYPDIVPVVGAFNQAVREVLAQSEVKRRSKQIEKTVISEPPLRLSG